MMRLILAFLGLLISFSVQLEICSKTTFIIISQTNENNDNLAKELENNIKEQSHLFCLDEPKIYISSKHFANTSADWTLVPLIEPVLNIIEGNIQWVAFLEDRTSVQLKTFLEVLEKYDSNQEIWVGHASYDSDATIIHHFAFYQDPTFFKYPNLGSGLALSIPLIKRLKTRVQNGFKLQDFHIDPAHEFALFVYDHGDGPMMKHDSYFCSKKGPTCASYPKKFEACGDANISSVFFAIKTCQKFHNDRVQVVKKTWHKYVEKSSFFSDVTDPEIPTLSLGIPNTEQGHCQKTLAILQYILQKFTNDGTLHWLALVDDDTVLSVSRMANLTACYKNPTQPLILGERYRFGAQGFDYPTGGAGILINRAALKILAKACSCPRSDSPDDMMLGACAQEFGVLLVHVPQMHQARPADYAPGRLASNDALSFHKHWMIDPIEIYEQLFLTDDQKIVKESYVKLEL